MGKSLGMGTGLVLPVAPTPEIRENEDLLEVIALELRRIRKRVALPIFEVPRFIDLLAGATQSFDTNGIECNAFVVRVYSGILELWLGSSAGQTNLPHFSFTDVGQPTQILLTPQSRQFSWRANGATKAVIIFQAL